jgi:group II intron reverse transcriptase/maturase
MARDLTRIGQRAREDRKARFTSIYHYVTDVDHLRASYKETERGKAPGIDGVGKEEYGEHLEENLRELSDRLGRLGYKPKPVKRVYIPKPGSKKKRPLGIPCFEDKIVQLTLTRVLEQIYEADFIEGSFGYRPGRCQHDALDELGRTIQQKKVSYVVEADIRGFFDHVHHEWLEKMLEERISDKRVLRLVARMLKGGVMEDGLTKASEEGVPQGGSLSPLLSNVYLHYALDLWFERVFRKSCRGEAYYFRYADDFLACFQYREEAERFLKELGERLRKFHLEVEPSKTKLIEFGRFAEASAARRGKKPETFDFLGFTHYCGQTRYGVFKVKRMSSRKKIRAKLKEVKAWLRQERNRLKTGELLQRAKQILAGHLAYYAITDNSAKCSEFRHWFTRVLYKWLNRRSQRRSYTWERFTDALAWVGWPEVRITVRLDPFRRGTPRWVKPQLAFPFRASRA